MRFAEFSHRMSRLWYMALDGALEAVGDHKETEALHSGVFTPKDADFGRGISIMHRGAEKVLGVKLGAGPEQFDLDKFDENDRPVNVHVKLAIFLRNGDQIEELGKEIEIQIEDEGSWSNAGKVLYQNACLMSTKILDGQQ